MAPNEASANLRATWDDKDEHRVHEIDPSVSFDRYKREIMRRLGGKFS